MTPRRKRLFHPAVHAWRETVCWVAGHRWVSSWHRVRDTEPPHWTKGKQGNPYCEYVASWHSKCRRCRLRTADDSWYPLWREVAWTVSCAWNTWWIGVTCYWPWPKKVKGRGYSVTPWWAWLVNALVGAPLFAFEQLWFGSFWYRWRFPGFPGALAAEAAHRIAMWIESKQTDFRWIPPQDPTNPTEIGFWLRKQEAEQVEETGQWRMRIFVSGGVA